MPKALNPGKFRHKISFLNPPDNADEYGQPAEEQTVFVTVPASAEPLIGKELYTALTAQSKVEIKFRMRYLKGITDTMRIKYGSGIYEIISVVDFEAAHIELLCYCRLLRNES